MWRTLKWNKMVQTQTISKEKFLRCFDQWKTRISVLNLRGLFWRKLKFYLLLISILVNTASVSENIGYFKYIWNRANTVSYEIFVSIQENEESVNNLHMNMLKLNNKVMNNTNHLKKCWIWFPFPQHRISLISKVRTNYLNNSHRSKKKKNFCTFYFLVIVIQFTRRILLYIYL